MKCLLLIAALPLLISCGVYQALDDDSPDHLGAFALITPITAITGIQPDTRGQNLKPLSYYAGLIRARNDGEMTPERARNILAAMDRCFGDKEVKKMSAQEAESLFGPPDQEKSQSGWTILVFRIQGRKFGERWLTLG